MEDDLKKKNKKKMKTTKKNNGKLPKQKWKTNQSTKINLIGCDTIVNSPSWEYFSSFSGSYPFLQEMVVLGFWDSESQNIKRRNKSSWNRIILDRTYLYNVWG